MPKLTRSDFRRALLANGVVDLPPESRPRQRRTTRTPEAAVIREVASFLRRHPRVAWAARINTGVARYGKHNERFVRFGAVGMSDFIGQMTDGRFLAVECKAPDGKLSDEQADFLARVKAYHGVAIVARSVGDLGEI